MLLGEHSTHQPDDGGAVREEACNAMRVAGQKGIDSGRRTADDAEVLRLIVGLASVLVAVVVGCAAPAASPTPAQSSADSPGGGSVNIGAHRLWASCAGHGSPTVVLEGGTGSTFEVWKTVQAQLAPSHRVCSYDRAGLGRSDPIASPETAGSADDDLQALPGALGLKPPYILVGWSFGGMIVQLHVRRHPAETAGMVLVDSSSVGLTAVLNALLPPDLLAELKRQEATGQAPDLDASDREIEAAPAFPNIPLIVLAHGKPVLPGGSQDDPWEKAWRSTQVQLASLSPQGRLEVAQQSDHNIPTEEPDLVVRAVADLTRDRHRVRKSLPV